MSKFGNTHPVIFFILLPFALFLVIPPYGACQELPIDFSYLDSQIREIRIPGGEKIKIWKTGQGHLNKPEIAATTLEIAYVTRAYLTHYEIFEDEHSLEKALDGINFLLHMQADNGCFYNYLMKSGNIDKESPQSAPTLGEHTAAAFIALARSTDIIKSKSPDDYRRVEESIRKVEKALEKWFENPERSPEKDAKFEKIKVPASLIMGRGDLTAIYLLGLSIFYENHSSARVKELANTAAEAIIKFKNTDPDIYPVHTHLTFSEKPYLWKPANAFQVAALARGGKVFSRESWIAEAEEEALGFQVRLLASYGPVEGFLPRPDLFPQMPLSAYTLTYNFSTLYKATGDEIYNTAAGLCASWFLGNNLAGKPVYSSDGSCKKEITRSGISSQNSLIGSACALLSLMEIYDTPASRLAFYKPEHTHTFEILESEKGRVVSADFEIKNWKFFNGSTGLVAVIRHQNTFWHKFKVDVEDDYFMLMSFLKQPVFATAVAVNVRIDGGPILLAPLGGADEEAYMVMKKITDPTQLLPGLHTVGVRYKGLLYTKPAIIDCVVLQPTMERKQLVGPSGDKIIIVKNWKKRSNKMILPDEAQEAEVKVRVKGLNKNNKKSLLTTVKGKKYLHVPGEGFGIIRW